MATSGVLPKIDGDILYAHDINANMINTAITDNINFSTILAKQSSITDKTYFNAVTDIFTSSTGYNNTVSGVNNCTFLQSGAIISMQTYDTFGGGSWNTNLFVSGNVAGSFTASIAGGNLNLIGGVSGTATNDRNDAGKVFAISGTLYSADFIVTTAFAQQAAGGASGAAYIGILVNNTPLTDVSSNFKTSNPISTYGDLTAGSYALIRISNSTWNFYKNGSFLRSFTGLAGSLVFAYSGCMTAGGGTYSSTDVGSLVLSYLNINHYPSGTLTTVSKNFDYNINSEFFNPMINSNMTDLSGLRNNIQVDISTNGGTSYDVTGRPVNNWSTLNRNNGSLVNRIVLTTNSSGISPWIDGYSAILT